MGNRDLGEIDTSIQKYYFKNTITGETITSIYPSLEHLKNIVNISFSDNTILFKNDSICYIGPKYKNSFMEVFNNGNFTNSLDGVNHAK